MSHTRTSTYSTLEISRTSFEDIKERLERVDSLNHYLTQDRQHGDMILFGEVGLVVDKATRTTMKACCKYHASGGPADITCADYTYTSELSVLRKMR